MIDGHKSSHSSLDLCSSFYHVCSSTSSLGRARLLRREELVLQKCRFTIKIPGDYVRPNPSCRVAVDHADMACICHILTIEEEKTVSVSKILRLARDCDQPVPAGNQCGSKYLIQFIFQFFTGMYSFHFKL